MKRYVILAAVAALLLLLFLVWSRSGGDASRRQIPEAVQTVAVGNSSNQSDAGTPAPEPHPMGDGPITAATNQDNEFLQLVRRADEAANVPVSFFGLVVNQDGNALQNVTVDLAVIEEWSKHLPEHKNKTTRLQKQTGDDGRFEVSGLRGKYVAVYTLTKEGFEQEFPGQARMYGAQSGSFNEPTVLRMWSTNIPRQQLIAGEVNSAIIPDGRSYRVDLTNAAVAEGTEGDLAIWLKRPAEVGWVKYDWSCELTANNGGLVEETGDQTMFIAPAAGYTNVFNYRQEAALNEWTHGLYGKRFYIRLRNGQMYGRITVNLSSSSNRQGPAMLRVEYAINPSGSRLLR